MPRIIGRCNACEYRASSLAFIPKAVTVRMPEMACTATAPADATRSWDKSVFCRKAFIWAKEPPTIKGKMHKRTNDIFKEPKTKAMMKAAEIVTKFWTERPRF